MKYGDKQNGCRDDGAKDDGYFVVAIYPTLATDCSTNGACGGRIAGWFRRVLPRRVSCTPPKVGGQGNRHALAVGSVKMCHRDIVGRWSGGVSRCVLSWGTTTKWMTQGSHLTIKAYIVAEMKNSDDDAE